MTDPARRAGIARVFECAHLVALALWLGVVVMSGVVAAVVFPLMKELDPTLAAYPLYTGEHAPLAAGRIAARVFLISDMAQYSAGAVVLVTTIGLIGWLGWNPRHLPTAVRALAVGAALLLVSYRVMVLAPRMDTTLRAYWDAAAAGRTEAAEASRAAFSADHPTASRVVSATAVAVLVALVAGAWGVQGPARRAGDRP